ncbi:MAG: hypothetical protein AAGI23_02195 [Bacteroidota bacterium]
MLLHIDIALLTKSYQQAFDSYEAAIRHRDFGRLNATSKEEWKIYGAYIYLLVIFKRVSISNSTIQQPVDPTKVLKEISIYTRDKKELNVAIIVYSIILLIHQHNYTKSLKVMMASRSTSAAT